MNAGILRSVTDDVKRRYRAPRRAEAAAQTRRRIRDAAAELFVADGYTATSLRAVAERADVGQRTVYDVFGAKAALFAETLGVAIVGDEEPVPVMERPEVVAARQAVDPMEALTATVDHAVALLERAGDLIMVSVEAAGSDPDMRRLAEEGEAATHAVHLALTTALHARGALRDGLTPQVAADVLFALLSPHLHQLVRRRRGWSVAEYRAWLLRSTTRELLAAPR